MRRLVLDPDQLRVDSFDPTPRAAPDGVAASLGGGGTALCTVTVGGGYTCDGAVTCGPCAYTEVGCETTPDAGCGPQP